MKKKKYCRHKWRYGAVGMTYHDMLKQCGLCGKTDMVPFDALPQKLLKVIFCRIKNETTKNRSK